MPSPVDPPKVASVPTYDTMNQLYMSELCLHMEVYDIYITRTDRGVNVYYFGWLRKEKSSLDDVRDHSMPNEGVACT